jgi:hypothetical protein
MIFAASCMRREMEVAAEGAVVEATKLQGLSAAREQQDTKEEAARAAAIGRRQAARDERKTAQQLAAQQLAARKLAVHLNLCML